MASIVNVSDSAAMPSTSLSGIGPFSFNDIFSSSFVVGEGNTSNQEKRSAQTPTTLAEGASLTPAPATSPLRLSPEMIAIIGAGGLALVLIISLAARR